MRQAIRFIPNLFTLGNLYCGFMALVHIAREEMITAVVFVAVALVLDFLDGFVARALSAQSELGVQLDSLADLVTSGIVPGFILYQMIVINEGYYFVGVGEWPLSVMINASVAALIPLAAAYRLAKFNLLENHASHFEGLPTPAMTMVVVGIPLVLEANYHLNFYSPLSNAFVEVLGTERRWDASDIWLVKGMFNTLTYQVLAVFLSLMMVSNIPMLSLKLKGWSWAANKWSYAILIWAVLCYLIFIIPYISFGPIEYGTIDYLILPIFMAGYFLLSFIYATFDASKSKPKADEIQS
ncbi:MAG: CDP-alcohol phosphatidyltransferase family protein [Cryomorphaceae bacterium]